MINITLLTQTHKLIFTYLFSGLLELSLSVFVEILSFQVVGYKCSYIERIVLIGNLVKIQEDCSWSKRIVLGLVGSSYASLPQ